MISFNHIIYTIIGLLDDILQCLALIQTLQTCSEVLLIVREYVFNLNTSYHTKRENYVKTAARVLCNNTAQKTK